ncbi:type I-E CRISPR-associated protein Cas5/CasD [Catenulispora yoronensis]
MSPHDATGRSRPGLLLHLSAPMQSWGQRSRFGERDSAMVPTRSGLIGLIAAAAGRPRSADIQDLRALRFLVRVDRPGTLLRDFHTVGGGRPNHHSVITAEGKRRSGDTATLVSTRYYLQDAAFTVAITADPEASTSTDSTADGAALLSAVTEALNEPKWPPFLGGEPARRMPHCCWATGTTTFGQP